MQVQKSKRQNNMYINYTLNFSIIFKTVYMYTNRKVWTDTHQTNNSGYLEMVGFLGAWQKRGL